MTPSSQETVTRLLRQLQNGNQHALNELFPLVYEELRRRAHRQRAHWQDHYTLNTTALVHEAYLKLVDQSQAAWESRAHFLSVAAKAMRHILVDYARRRGAQKRGGDVQKVSVEELEEGIGEVVELSEEHARTIVALDAALGRLMEENPREGQVVECRFFGRMSVVETAAVLGISPRTVKREWAIARAWLYRELERERTS